jgi:hypothetical protein
MRPGGSGPKPSHLGRSLEAHPFNTHTMNLHATIVARLNALGISTAPNSEGEIIAERLGDMVDAIRFYRAEGCPRLADAVITDSKWGKRLLDIVKDLADEGDGR